VTPPEDEELARTVLSPHLQGSLVSYDPRPDFALCQHGEPIGWVEVTRATDESSNRVEANLQRRGRKFYSDRLTHDWIVSFKRTADLRKLDQSRLEEALRLQELFDMLSALTESDTQQRRRRATDYVRNYPRVRSILDEHHVWTCHPLREAEDRSAQVLLTMQSTGGFAKPETIVELAEEKMRIKKKSLEGLTGQRHLFVLVDINDRSGASIAMGGYDAELPTRLPDFPLWATDVWLMPLYFEIRLWHASRDLGAWEVIDVDVSTL
jgi:hypothetical protein